MTAYIKNGTTDHLKHLDQEDYSYAVADKPTMFDPTLPTIGKLSKELLSTCKSSIVRNAKFCAKHHFQYHVIQTVVAKSDGSWYDVREECGSVIQIPINFPRHVELTTVAIVFMKVLSRHLSNRTSQST